MKRNILDVFDEPNDESTSVEFCGWLPWAFVAFLDNLKSIMRADAR